MSTSFNQFWGYCEGAIDIHYGIYGLARFSKTLSEKNGAGAIRLIHLQKVATRPLVDRSLGRFRGQDR
ncbi:hypothetical protein EMIT0196MI5_300032 [Pseudomonas sp. IT-196MI5]